MDLESQLDLPDAEAWRPDEGDKVIGTLVSIGEREGDWGPYPVFTLLTKDEELVAVHAFHGVLRNELENAQLGDKIGLKYLGMKQGAKQSYENYKVVIERNGGSTVDLAAHAAAGRTELADAGATAPVPGTKPPVPEEEEPF